MSSFSGYIATTSQAMEGIASAFLQSNEVPNEKISAIDLSRVPPQATQTSSGLAYKVLQPASSEKKPSAQQKVRVFYTSWDSQGNIISQFKSRPLVVSIEQMIPGWGEGVQLMGEGAKFRFWIPQALAYNGRPNKPIGMVICDIELIEVLD